MTHEDLEGAHTFHVQGGEDGQDTLWAEEEDDRQGEINWTKFLELFGG